MSMKPGKQERKCGECGRVVTVGTSKGHAISCSVGNPRTGEFPPEQEAPELLPASEMIDRELVELALESHARALMYFNSKVQHDRANECRNELLKRLAHPEATQSHSIWKSRMAGRPIIHSSNLPFNGTELECDGNELRPDGTCAKCERVNGRIAAALAAHPDEDLTNDQN
jgi:hypothetical protein